MQPVLLFPGQGSQEPGMGRDLAEADAESMALWKKAEAISHLPLREIYWEGDAQAQSDTRALQPALTVVNINLWRAVAGKLSPTGAAGHSLGEFSALAAAQVLTPEVAVEITTVRGQLMADADPDGKGAMAAIVKLDEAKINTIVAEVREETGEMLLTANYNTPTQLVVSGARAAVNLACKKAAAQKGRGLPLKVSGAFHSPMMAEANRELDKLLGKVRWERPRFPVYCNLNGQPATDGGSIRDCLARQMISPVRWIATIRRQYNDGARSWLELGPKAILGKMVAPCLKGIAAEGEELKIALVSNRESAEAFCL